MHELYSTLDKGLTPISFFYPEFPIPAHWKRNKAREQVRPEAGPTRYPPGAVGPPRPAARRGRSL